MTSFPRITLQKHKAEAVKRFHPWIFSGAIKKKQDDLQEGAIVEVYSDSGEYLATGHYGTGSIAVKIFAFEPIQNFQQLLLERLKDAYLARVGMGLVGNSATTCYRLVNAEGDGLPGLIIDWYHGTAIIQAHSVGMYEQRHAIAQALQQVYGQDLKAVYEKSALMLSKQAAAENKGAYLFGEPTDREVLEYNHRFRVDWEEGQKTGFFIDQRENRALLAHYVTDRRVLNTFCYSGGFSVYAVQSGASLVHSVDTSARAIEWTEENVALNNPHQVPHATYTKDVFDFLKQCEDTYDVIVLDPPAFAKGLSARHQAMMAYKRLNMQAFSKLTKGGIVFTFSCSQVVTPEHFNGAITAAAIESGKRVRVLHHLTQPADHPVSIYHPEGLYLKGLVLMVD
ncbi:MAG: class I SAM-dependent rRNA methyltransferase [Leptolyngbyaceae cyanobacterium bins.59]|nr:class I SAM-dependent rRNA methyltransferase [Leptolyngbyaceae cyanobacterium bins.59]